MPIVINIAFNGVIAVPLSNHFIARITDLEKLLTEKLRRVEEVLDARLKHIEEERR